METKKESSQSDSKTHLNESTLPLLDDQQVEGVKEATSDKEKMEMESHDEKEDTVKGKVEGEKDEENSEDKGNVATEEETEKKNKKKNKEKTRKSHKRNMSYGRNLTIGLNLLDRDEKHINDHINVVFEDVVAEPEANQGFDDVWRVGYLTFSLTKHWIYRILAILVVVPCSILWGLVFSLLALLNVWFVTPLLKFIDVILNIVKR
ncbi:caveolin-1-like, partial [Limulus polyphemus]|uniref:Caveolin n=1 Tax=Limulus polyphemus TaxID=6850 RepID=A0ABM1BWV0_LIMPO